MDDVAVFSLSFHDVISPLFLYIGVPGLMYYVVVPLDSLIYRGMKLVHCNRDISGFLCMTSSSSLFLHAIRRFLFRWWSLQFAAGTPPLPRASLVGPPHQARWLAEVRHVWGMTVVCALGSGIRYHKGTHRCGQFLSCWGELKVDSGQFLIWRW